MKKNKTTSKEAKTEDSSSQRIDGTTKQLNDWRGQILARIRTLIKQADPDVVEEIKWRKPSSPAGVPVWSHNGIICTGETYKDKVKLTFAKGASLEDPSRLFNSSLDGNTRRAIDIHEGEKIDARAFKALVKAALAENRPLAKAKATDAKASPHTIHRKDGSLYGQGQMLDGKMHGYWEFFRKDGTIMRSGSFDREQQIGTWTTYDATGKSVKVTEMKSFAKAKPRAEKSKTGESKAKPTKMRKNDQGVVLLSGGNPQIAKADGDAPVQAYIAAMPGWKSDLGKRLDALIERNVPGVRKTVKWNSPFYGAEGQKGWFLSYHCFTKYVKVTFFDGTSLRPIPPGGTPKSKDVRWIDIYEDDPLDEAQMATWIKQAAALPGWVP